MKSTFPAALLALATLFSPLLAPTAGAVDVLTYHNDVARTGLNDGETALTPANVNTNSFGKLFSHAVDGLVYAQPLYMANVPIAGKGTHNTMFIATLHDGVYAFDADDNLGANSNALWYVSFIDPAHGTNTVPYTDVTNADDIVPEFGIIGTPVIDPATGTLYVVAKTKETTGGVTNYVQRLHALDIGSGAEKFGGPVAIQASTPGTGVGSNGGFIDFTALHHNQRAALLLHNGRVTIAWGSHADIDPYHGWVMSYNATNLQQEAAFCVLPDGSHGGIWMYGCGPSVDADGSLYLVTADGTFDADIGGKNYGDSVLKLNPGTLGVDDYFTPFNQLYLDTNNKDLGASGAVVLPDQPGAHPHLLAVGSKHGSIYLLDRDNMGGFHVGDDSQVVQTITNLALKTFGVPAYWNSRLYFMGLRQPLTAFQLTNGLLSTNPVSQSDVSWNFPSSTPCISANGNTNAIVWVLQNDGYNAAVPAVLRAYDAMDLSVELYTSNQAGARDLPGVGVKSTVPTIANGKVYVGTQYQVDVFGLFSNAVPPAVTITSPSDNLVVTNNLIDVAGTVTSDHAITSVEVANSRGGSTPAVVNGTNWLAANVFLLVGTNQLTAVATDDLANQGESGSITVVLVSTNATVDTTLRTVKATLGIAAPPKNDKLTLTAEFNPTGLTLDGNTSVTVQFGDFTETLPPNALATLKYKAKASPTNAVTGFAINLKKHTITLKAQGFALTNADPFLLTFTLGTNTLGPDSITFPVPSATTAGSYKWAFGKPQLPGVDQFFLGKSKLTTNSFQIRGAIHVAATPDARVVPVMLGIGSFSETLDSAGWTKGAGNVYEYERPAAFDGAVESMTIDFDAGSWSARGSGADLGSLSANGPTSFRLAIGGFEAEFPATLISKGSGFAY